jgi:hypothetical protein
MPIELLVETRDEYRRRIKKPEADLEEATDKDGD